MAFTYGFFNSLNGDRKYTCLLYTSSPSMDFTMSPDSSGFANVSFSDSPLGVVTVIALIMQNNEIVFHRLAKVDYDDLRAQLVLVFSLLPFVLMQVPLFRTQLIIEIY